MSKGQGEFETDDFKKIKNTPLGKSAQAYVDKKQEIEQAKLELSSAGRKVVEEMKKIKKQTLCLAIDGQRHNFEIIDSQEKLRVTKESRTPKGNKPESEV